MVWKTRTGVYLQVPPAFDGAEASIIRGQCGLTQAEMAEQMGCSPRKVWEWERQGRSYHFQSFPQRHILFAMMEKARAAQLES